jgi:lipid II:glycine glycyltransferase (peptidoglycan interpeptide bridge formation enzyme)
VSAAPFFFQSSEFIFRNTQIEIVSFRGKNGDAIHFTQMDLHLVSCARSPFGGFVVPEIIDKKNLKALIEDALHYSKSNKIESIEIKCYPEIYAPEHAAIENDILSEVGFNLKYKDITQALFINGKISLNPDRNRKIKECVGKNFRFQELTVEALPQSYNLFLQSRKSKGYPLTMELMDFFDEFRKFPSKYKLYGVLDGDHIIAASVVILVNDQILYYFFSGDDLDYRKYSPTTFLIFNLYHLAAEEGFKFIDLGISTDKGILNQGLYNFKKSFGAVDSFKLTFEKKV